MKLSCTHIVYYTFVGTLNFAIIVLAMLDDEEIEAAFTQLLRRCFGKSGSRVGGGFIPFSIFPFSPFLLLFG